METDSLIDNEPLISVNKINTFYGDRHILKNISLDVKPGEIMVVMGGSGSGKSTLLKNILGLVKPPWCLYHICLTVWRK